MRITDRFNAALDVPARIHQSVGVALIVAGIALLVSLIAIGVGVRNAN
jgi:hypothetical protein